MLRQPCTWANRGANSNKSTDGIWITQSGQQAFRSNTELNTLKCRVLSSPQSPLSWLEDRSSPMSSSPPQQWGEHPSSSHRFTKLRPWSAHSPPPWGADETSPDCAFPSHSLCCHLQPHDSPGGTGWGPAWGAHPTQTLLRAVAITGLRLPPPLAELPTAGWIMHGQ